MTLRTISTLLAASAALLSAAGGASAEIATRIAANIDNTQRVALANSQSPHAVAAFDQGSVSPTLQLHGIELDFAMSDAQKTDLTTLLAAQQDPSSPQYHQWLTPAQFGARFGLSDADLAKAQSWLQAEGFTVESVSPNRLSISFSGTAAQVKSAFSAELHNFKSPTDTEAHFAPAGDLTIPAALSGVVTAVHHLSSFRPQPHLLQRAPVAVRPNFTSSQTGNHFLTPADIATVYNLTPAYNSGYNGAGQTIAVAGQSAIVASDISNFQTAAGLTVKAPTITIIPNSGTSQVYSQDESESDLDIEYAAGIAPGATINFIYAGNSANYGVFDAVKYAITNNLAQIITVSYGECEVTATDVSSLETALAEAATQGQTVINSTGDEGSTACAGQTGTTTLQQQTLNVSYPASSAYVLAVGGTEFPAADTTSTNTTYWSSASGSDVLGSALSYIPEQAWNDDAASSTLGNSLSSGGGGVSTLFNRPSWQTGVSGIPTGFYRLIPDVSLAASPSYPGYLYCSSDTDTGITGSCSHGFRDTNNNYLTVAGGTSFAAPIVAGMVAILNQYRNATGGQGLITPTLYALAANSSTYASAFHDITSGGNECTVGVTLCGSGNANLWYTAGTGYDEATGLGSVNFYNLLTAWASVGGAKGTKSFTVAAATSPLTIASGSSGTATVTVTPAGGYTGTVAWSISSSPQLNYACYTLPNVSITGTTAATATLTIQTTNSSCQAGAAFKTTVGASRAGATSSAANHAPASAASPANGRGSLPAGLALAGLLATGCCGRRSRRLKALRGIAAMGLLAVLGLSLTGCSGAASSGVTTTTTVTTVSQTVQSATKGTYTLTLTGTDTATPSITANTTLTLTID